MPHVTVEGKKLHYVISGSGEHALLLLHGNTASSRMFQPVLPLYEKHFSVLTMDFLGHGNSDRLEEFSPDLWHSQAMQAARLLDALNLRAANVIGTSGGALVALNLALEHPDLVRKVIADSFEGEIALDAVASTIAAERARAKSDASAVRFWRDCHGEDWEVVVDNDTQAIVRHHTTIKSFFHRELSSMNMPVLLTASHGDEFAAIVRFPETYADMLRKIPLGETHFFPAGGHPALLSNPAAFAELAEGFFLHREGDF